MSFAPITLGLIEQRLVCAIARGRSNNNNDQDVNNQKIGPQSDYESDVEGAGGEVGFAMTWNVWPDMRIRLASAQNGTDAGDCVLSGYPIDVKATPYDNGCLVATAGKKPGNIEYYALMVGKFPTYEFRGFMAAGELLRPERLGRLKPNYALTYIAKQSELIMRLPDEELYLFHERVAIKMESGIPIELAERQAHTEMRKRK